MFSAASISIIISLRNFLSSHKYLRSGRKRQKGKARKVEISQVYIRKKKPQDRKQVGVEEEKNKPRAGSKIQDLRWAGRKDELPIGYIWGRGGCTGKGKLFC